MNTDYLKRELAEFLDLSRKAVAHFQSGPSISTGGVVVTVAKSGGTALMDFHERCEALEKVLRTDRMRGEICGHDADKRSCPNADYNDGDETWRLDCDLCKTHVGGEHPQ